jgi:glycine oxidase
VSNSVHYIIVGQGLAGTTLALRLLKQGKRIMIFDQPADNRSSVIAAGLFNPVTGKLMTKTWLAEKIFPELQVFYSEAEKTLGAKFYYPQPIYRPFISVEEQNEWMGKSINESLRTYIKEVLTKSYFGNQVHDAYGGIVLDSCGYLDVKEFLAAAKNLFTSLGAYQVEWFDESQLQMNEGNVNYRDIVAEKIIFCGGTHSNSSSLFSFLPVRKLKGETLEIEISEQPELIYNRGVFIVPMNENRNFKVGATYETRLLTPEITEQAKAELTEKLSNLLKIPYKILSQDWGYRPTTPDRKPILGPLPGNGNLIIFNGLGTKGVSLAPYFSAQLADWLAGKSEIQVDVNINRFKSLFSKSIV